MSGYRAVAGISTFVYALFIFTYPASYFNDDSLFLAEGIKNFSVIDFSPHFPGYPSIVIFGKIINFFINDAKYSLFILTALSAVFIPFVLFLYTKKIQDEKTAFMVFLLSLTSPYIVNLSLSMLSDSIGLLSLFLGLYLLELNKNRLGGIILAVSFFSRPSYFVFFIAGLLYLYIFKKDSLKPILVYFFSTSAIFLLFIFINNGMLYFYEGARFVEGHFSLWGRGQNSDISWFENIFSFVNIPYIFLIFLLFRQERKLMLLYMLFVFYFCWILFAQNPDNLRHMIPLVFIANIFLAFLLDKTPILPFLIAVFNLFYTLSYDAEISPIEQIAKEIDSSDRIVIANRGVEILRSVYGHRVADGYYHESAKYLNENNKTYIITAQKPKEAAYGIYKGRFIGEKKLYLVKE